MSAHWLLKATYIGFAESQNASAKCSANVVFGYLFITLPMNNIRLPPRHIYWVCLSETRKIRRIPFSKLIDRLYVHRNDRSICIEYRQINGLQIFTN